ncbi:aldo/keto reductase [Arthrobacter sp. B2a2-09]|uniref:aldo/keto reductase n=1 Tax=Arthrobacter sp. B2a2-09 TaxID=2952822 RepID=UPI0022CD4104|nr:aldo/keto reductase [Arthrobacter sp. B2a2-09]MCZ9880959.1 aldo/keto reductase [Arthrobacter sp. B2a2-09]
MKHFPSPGKAAPVAQSNARSLGRGGLRVGPYAFGVAPLANLGRQVSEADAYAAVDAAWQAGIRYFDVAPHYGLGLGEQRIGAALAQHPRGEYILSTKVGRLLVDNPEGMQPDTEGFDVVSPLKRKLDYSRDGVLRSVEESLSRLGLDYIDIAFVHDPDDHYREALDGAFPALEELRSQGLIRSYGAGMNQSRMLTDFVLNTDLDVIMCAGRYTLLEQGPLDDLLPAATSRGVSIVAAAVFNSGILARDRPSPQATYNYEPAPKDILARVNAIADVCERHSVPLPAAAIQYPLLHPTVATVCVGARSAEQVTRNVALFDVQIPGALWQELAAKGLIRPDATHAAMTGMAGS